MVTAHMSLYLSKKSGSELKAGCWFVVQVERLGRGKSYNEKQKSVENK